jgi:hypothetical protein
MNKSIDYNKEFHDAYSELLLIEEEIENMIEKPENEYDKGWNRACKVILQSIGEFRYRMELRVENDLDWIESVEE